MEFSQEIIDNVIVLHLKGDLIGESDGFQVVDAVNDFVNKGKNKCLLDISGVRYINSSGFGVLITILTKLRNKDGELVLMKPSESVQRLLIMTKLNAIFSVVEDVQEGLSKLNSI